MLIAIVAWARPAVADDPPSAETRVRASELVEKGRALQERGEYREAIRQYRAAYRLIPHPQLLYNLGQAYRLSGQKRRALKLYSEYLERSPNGATADLARRFVTELREELAEDERDDRRARASGRTVNQSMRRAGYVAAGAGLVGVVVGAGFGYRASSIANEFDGAVWQPDEQERYDTGRSSQRIMYIGYGVGAAALVTGAVLYVLSGRSGRGEAGDLALGGSASDSHAGVWLRGRF